MAGIGFLYCVCGEETDSVCQLGSHVAMPFWLGCEIGWNYPFFQTAFQGQGRKRLCVRQGYGWYVQSFTIPVSGEAV
ncbi:hypothetical protein l11_03570 [Neisseria weaveri LMG 5135]|nr:hypothetical protein l11_03570 [Neisseria weaveri LMG 5135]